jgi:hypothetical protein
MVPEEFCPALSGIFSDSAIALAGHHDVAEAASWRTTFSLGVAIHNQVSNFQSGDILLKKTPEV